MSMRAVVLGLGEMGRHHSRILQASERVVYAGGVEIGDAGQAVGERVYRSLEHLLAKEREIDFAVVALPTSLHGEAATTLAGEGIHLLIEKPLALNSVEAASIVSVCDRAKVHGAVGHVERHNPALVELKRLLTAGALGRPQAIITERAGPVPPRIRDAGVLADLATHDLDLIPWLVGEPIESLFAQTASPSGSSHEHFAAVTGRMPSGAVFNTVVDWRSPLKIRRVRVICEEGAFVADTLNPSLVRAADDSSEIPLAQVEPLAAQMDAFCDLLVGHADAPVVSLEEGLRAVAWADAALRSTREQRIVAL